MSVVIRVTKEKNFTIIDNGIFKDTKLSMKAKGLLTTMLSLPQDWNFSIEGLTKLCADGETAVRNTLHELISNGYLKRERITDEKGRVVDWQYTIYEERQPVSQSPVVEKTQLDNPPQLSTNILSTKELSSKVSTNVDTSPTYGVSVSDLPTEDVSQVVDTTTPSTNNTIRKPQKILTEEKTKERKPNLYERCQNEIVNRYGLGRLNASLHEYLGYRIRSRQHPMGFSGWVGLLNKLDVLGQTEDEKCKIVEQSIKMKWDTFVELKTWGKKTGCERFGEHADMRSGAPVGDIMTNMVF